MKASVIILNYNGEKVIQLTLDSVLASKCKDDFEIIVVDNNSQDDSKTILAKYKKNPLVKLLYLDDNYGFAGGNNRGLNIATGEYVILLNNDCPVEKNWLQELIKCADKNKNAFSINSKICLYPRYFSFSLPLLFPATINHLKLHTSHLLDFQREKKPLNIAFKQDFERQVLAADLPFDYVNDEFLELEIEASFVCDSFNHEELKNTRHLFNFNEALELSDCQILKKNSRKITYVYRMTLPIGKETKQSSFRVIQNAGSLVFQDGYGRDIGAIVSGTSQTYEHDLGQFDQEKQVYSTCGAAVLYRKSYLDKLGGGLDDTFFMYYEDTALAEQGLLSGYDNLYCPTAQVNHLHALSSGEWSDFFIFHVEKGRLLHLFYNFPTRIFRREFIKFIITACARLAKNILKRQKQSADKQYFKVIADLITKYFFYKKHREQRYAHHKNAVEKHYQKILNGDWYFN